MKQTKDKPVILVVDDDKPSRIVIKENLQIQDYKIEEAENGKEAVEKATDQIPDLILMDLAMPVLNGLEAIKIIKENEKTSRIPIIVITAFDSRQDRIKAFEYGAMDFITKPFNKYELIARVKSHLRFSLLNKKYVLSTINLETGLPNRAAFREKLQECANPKLFLFKIDNIDTTIRYYGELAGSKIEKEFAGFLSRELPDECQVNSYIYRLGRGMFGWLMDDQKDIINREKSLKIGEHFHETFLKNNISVKDVQYDIDFTVAITFRKDNMLEMGESALDEATKNKTKIIFADDVTDEIHDVIGKNIFWLKKIKTAVNNDRLIPFFQPIYNNFTKKIEKYEALLRLIDEEGKVTPPGLFLDVAKNSKYYYDITKAMIKKSMLFFKDRPEEFSVNLSVLDIEDTQMRGYLINSLKEEPSVASRMILEIVEQEGVKQIEIVKEFIKQVKQYGVKISIDDFGSGYSNFRTLVDLNADFIKIDGSLIKNICNDPTTQNVVEIIKLFAEKSGIKVIAEFVENREIFDYLKNINIEYSQGYFIGKPEQSIGKINPELLPTSHP